MKYEEEKGMDWNVENNMLTTGETCIMKVIWDEKEDISVPDLIEKLRMKFREKNYARTTVVTFLLKMDAKGYVKTYRKGKISYVHAMKSEEEYKDKLLRDMVDFWYNGDFTALGDKLNNMQQS